MNFSKNAVMLHFRKQMKHLYVASLRLLWGGLLVVPTLLIRQ